MMGGGNPVSYDSGEALSYFNKLYLYVVVFAVIYFLYLAWIVYPVVYIIIGFLIFLFLIIQLFLSIGPGGLIYYAYLLIVPSVFLEHSIVSSASLLAPSTLLFSVFVGEFFFKLFTRKRISRRVLLALWLGGPIATIVAVITVSIYMVLTSSLTMMSSTSTWDHIIFIISLIPGLLVLGGAIRVLATARQVNEMLKVIETIGNNKFLSSNIVQGKPKPGSLKRSKYFLFLLNYVYLAISIYLSALFILPSSYLVKFLPCIGPASIVMLPTTLSVLARGSDTFPYLYSPYMGGIETVPYLFMPLVTAIVLHIYGKTILGEVCSKTVSYLSYLWISPIIIGFTAITIHPEITTIALGLQEPSSTVLSQYITEGCRAFITWLSISTPITIANTVLLNRSTVMSAD